MENYIHPTQPIPTSENQSSAYRTRGASKKLLEESQLAVLAVMDERGDDTACITKKDIYEQTSVNRNSITNNFFTIDDIFLQTRLQLINDITTRFDSLSSNPYLNLHNAVWWLLKFLREHPAATELAARRFDVSFWVDILLPISSYILTPWERFDKLTRSYLFTAYAAIFAMNIKNWSQYHFPIEKINHYVEIMELHHIDLSQIATSLSAYVTDLS